MGNLVKPYEISVWDDIWNGDRFIEERLLVIGTDEMASMNKAIEPVLTRNVNGTKKFSFKMYKRYTDSETGEEIINPFIDYLVSERKVKLYYEDRWYDFIIKNINETSTNYLYSFDLEDAIVQELSKNGFGVTLDAQLNNNMGTAKGLAEFTLRDTDWVVGECDILV
jgi:tRNA(Ile)-lysidine synthase TilS/MesJ